MVYNLSTVPARSESQSLSKWHSPTFYTITTSTVTHTHWCCRWCKIRSITTWTHALIAESFREGVPPQQPNHYLNRDSPLYHHDTSPDTVDDTQSSHARYQHVTHLYYPPAHVLSLDPLQIPPRPKHHTTFYQFVTYSKLTEHYSNNRLTSIHPFPLIHLLLDNPTWHEHQTKKSSGKSKEISSTVTQTSIS